MPIVVSLDLHGVLTRRMLREADAIVCYLTYPHVDFRSTGERAARLLLRILDDGVRPVTARVTIPALVRGEELITDTGSFGRLTRRAAALEASDGGLSAGILISNPFTDVPELLTSVFVTTDADPDRAAAEALDPRHRLLGGPRDDGPAAHLARRGGRSRRRRRTDGTIILTDAADATSSGASGDSNAILRALADGGYRGTVLAPIVDAPRGRGGHRGRGGRHGPDDHRRPVRSGAVHADAVRGRGRHALGDGRYTSESDGLECRAGPTAVLQERVA